MLTKTGTKLLDFGLAKLKQEVAPDNAQLSQLPTADDPLTAQGMIVGTLQYMAPEQLEGKDVDARTDIFAFGALVYEMATGKRAFDGKSQASVISAIMSSDPLPMSTLRSMTLPAGQRLDLGLPIAISPDGTRLVYSAGSSNITTQLYIRAMDGLQTAPVPGTEGAHNPFFSPDGQWIGFNGADGKLKKVSLSGGASV